MARGLRRRIERSHPRRGVRPCGRVALDDVHDRSTSARFHPGYVAWGRQWETFAARGNGVRRIGGNGFGCVLLRRSIARQTTFTHAAETGDFDWNFYYWLARHEGGRYRALLDWSCEAQHLDPHSGSLPGDRLNSSAESCCRRHRPPPAD